MPVTVDNIIRAESDTVFTGLVAQGGFGNFYRNRELTPIDSRMVKRPSRDTLYSTGVFDLDAGPLTITLPDAGNRFLTMIVIDEDHYVFTVVYATLEHLLLALIDDVNASGVMKACDVDLGAPKERLVSYIDNEPVGR
jgi:hypothetical protein